jgi:methionyl-tRNA formyltransferase
VVETLAGLANGAVKPQPQNHERATYAPLLDREDGRMDFAARTSHELLNRWRGFQPWPGAFTTLDGKKLIAHRMQIAGSGIPPGGIVEPGTIRIVDKRVLVACAQETWLELVEVQLEGKKRMTAAEFLRGNPLPGVARLGA